MALLFWSSHEEIPHVQGKRNPSKTVDVGERASEGRHTETIIRKLDMDHSLV